MNAKATQQTQMAGKTKLTAVSLYHGQCAVKAFVQLHHDERGRAIMPLSLVNQLLVDLRRGDTLTVG